MEFQHFLHHHKLSSVEFEENNMPLCLPGCMDIVAGPAYCCRECPSFVMHKSCAELPPQVLESTTKMLFDSQRKEENYDNQCLKMEGRVHHETEVQSSSFHPQHHLRTFAMMNYINPICSACREIIEGPVFSCIPCSAEMHYSCAKYQFREMKHGCHADHHLLHLEKGLFGNESP
ncbi:hypothetical protein V6N13_088380 [Hibiscus sabdariffa]